ncbi:aldehyde dehydrogenase family protein, partial [Staphylococcus epidermidis]|uniref:aldehyde dehydrogenase family protein n=1 Tax=Staphylococcus epidermidis TaxID=1282 RepID=UPI0011A86A83
QTHTPLSLFPTNTYIKKQPYPTLLIIPPFNYPLQLLFHPLIPPIPPPNTPILKPSHLTPHLPILINHIIQHTFHE